VHPASPIYAEGFHGSPVRDRAAAGRVPPTLPPTLPDTELPGASDWPLDALSGLVAEAVAGEAAVAQHRSSHGGLGDIDEQPSPFAVPHARGMALRRNSVQGGYSPQLMMSPPPVSRGGLNLQANWPGFGPMMAPPEDSSVFSGGSFPGQAHIPGAGHNPDVAGGFNAGSDMPADRYLPPGPQSGPGHIPIGIRPSIQAQSAMLRELYPRGP
jgi:hypothetical protein